MTGLFRGEPQHHDLVSSEGVKPHGVAPRAAVVADDHHLFTGAGDHTDPVTEISPFRHDHGIATRILATAQLEQLLCDPRASDTLTRLLVPAQDSWSVRFPDLTALPASSGDKQPLTVCVATEDIVGPVRNGGIGTTYAALAQMLAAEGHHTTILYLRGQEVETGTLDYWIDHYAAMNVHFVPVPNYAVRDGFRSVADKWLRAPYNMFRYLVDHPMDVVHVSEWHGSGYLSLLAKRQGIAFQNTLFVVKTSSPWMWNRMYGCQPLERREDITKVHAERRSVELADVVIGGSLHLIRWMLSQGYTVPRERTFVQPNVVDFDHLKPFIGRRSLTPGSRVPIDEIVFFGRLEARKGLFTFCQAVRRLIRQGTGLPPKISFMGKPGAKLTARPDQTILEYIQSETGSWPVEVTILTEYQQQEAIEYLLTGSRLAVMPSTIENSSLAVYEAAICGIPFVASNVGGTPELISAEDYDQVLCAPHPIPLAAKLAEAIEKGGYLASPSFDNEENLAVWKRFHADLGGSLRSRLLPVHAANLSTGQSSVGVCLYYTGDLDALKMTLDSLAAQQNRPSEVLIAVDALHGGASNGLGAIAGSHNLPFQIIETFDFDAGLSFNALAEIATSDFLLMMWEGGTLSAEALSALARVMALSGADVLNFFYREITRSDGEVSAVLKANIIGSPTEAFFRTDLSVQPLFVRREAFLRIGGFTTDYRVLCYDQEFLSKAQLSGLYCETALVELATVQALSTDWLNERCYDQQTSYFRAIRPQLATVPLAIRDLLLMAKGLSADAGPRRKRPAGREPAEKAFGRVLRAMGNSTVAEPVTTRNVTPAKRAPIERQSASIDNLMRLLEEADRTASGSASKEQPPGPVHGTVPPSPAKKEKSETRKGNVARRTTIERRLLYVLHGTAYGWAFDGTAPDRVLQVEALEDGEVVHTVSASQDSRMTGRGAKLEVADRFFALDLYPGLMARRLKRSSRTVDLRVVDTDVFIARDIEVFAPAATMKRSRYQGFCEPSAVGAVNGWVWMPSDPDKRLEVDIFVGARFVGRTQAEIFREDLLDAGIGSGHYGFHLQLGGALLGHNDESIAVVISKSGLPLTRSPMTIKDRRIVIPVRSPLIGRVLQVTRRGGQ